MSTGQQVLFNAGRSLPALRLQAGFHGDFISGKLLIKFHIYVQKIKSLDLFEIGFYEFWLWQLSQAVKGLHCLELRFQGGDK